MDDHAYHNHTSLTEVVRHNALDWGRARKLEKPIPAQAIVWGATGYHGYQNGPDLRTIDKLALSDALLARLPARNPEGSWGRGHIARDLPEGYITSVETAENRIVDGSLHEFYDKVLIITTGPLFTMERMRTIWKMNTGAYSHLVEEYEGRRLGAK
jgi:arabinofuranosyltransferase